MKIKTRLTLMLVLVAVLIGMALLFQLRSENEQTQGMLANLREEADERLDGLLGVEGRHDPVFELGYQSLQNFASDYAHWAEMGSFVSHVDPTWAAANIDTDLTTFKAHAVWVLRPDGTQVYGAVRLLAPAMRTLPLPLPALQTRLMHERHLHFFLDSPDGLLEVVGTPLEPANSAPAGLPQGWFLVARLWDQAQLKSLSALIEGDLTLLRPGEAPPPPGEGISLVREMKGWDGQVIRRLHIHYLPTLLKERLHSDESESFIVAFFGLLVVVVAFLAILLWVIRPLRRLEQSLSTGSAAPLASLQGESNEFGRLARLAESSFQHRDRLEHEIQERQRTEEALRISLQLRQRLARDLHDSVIQSIYATGLGLESVRQELDADQPEAEQRLTAAQTQLNRTIREIRSFIADLEPEETPTRPFADELRFLADTLSSLHPVRISVSTDASAATLLTPNEQTHALQIVRETVSNALRHGQAGHIILGLRLGDGQPELEISDDGRGFEPLAAAGQGRGLDNMIARAAEIGARLTVDSAPGRGTRIRLRFRTPGA
jgi:signal transduction histidine kinase